MNINKSKKIESILGSLIKKVEKSAFSLLWCTHSSYANEKKVPSYERLEFLGDAFVDLLAAKFLFFKFPDKPEGYLSNLRSKLVNEQTLALFSKLYGLNEYLLLNKGEEKQGGRDKDSINADIVESFLGVCYILNLQEEAYDMMCIFWEEVLANIDQIKDPRSALIEWTAKNKMEINFEFEESNGKFSCKVYIEGKLIAKAEDLSKKKAARKASKQVLDLIKGGKINVMEFKIAR